MKRPTVVRQDGTRSGPGLHKSGEIGRGYLPRRLHAAAILAASLFISVLPTAAGGSVSQSATSGDGVGVTGTHLLTDITPLPVGSAATCADVYFIGARGSGENGPDFKRFHGLGPEVAKMESVMARVLKAHEITWKTLPDPYKADSVDDLKPTAAELALFTSSPVLGAKRYYDDNVTKFLASLDDGIQEAVLLAKGEHRLCPHAVLIMAGYSQGAMAIHQAELQLAAGHDTGVLNQIAATLLLADGDRVKNTAAKEFGTSPTTAEGIRAWLSEKLHLGNSKDVYQPTATANICNAGDIVCDFAVKRLKDFNAAVKIHESYTDDPATAEAAAWAAGLVTKHFGPWTASGVPIPGNVSDINPIAAACPSPSACVAVGYYADNNSGNYRGFLIAGSGTKWTATVAPLPANANTSADYGLSPPPQAGEGPQTFSPAVACPSATDCTAVGFYTDSHGDTQGLLLTGSGSSWTPIEAPLPASAAAHPGASLTAVSCASANSCVAVGSFTDSSGDVQGLLEVLSGTTWTPIEAPELVTGNPRVQMSWVSCPSATACTAVGQYIDSLDNAQGLLLTGSGTSWTATEAPLPGNAGTETDAALSSVACPSATACTVTGTYNDSSGTHQGMLVSGSGTSWTATEVPLPANAGTDPDVVMLSVTCPSATSCSALGAYIDSSDKLTGLLLTGSDTSWVPAEAPLPAGGVASPAPNVQGLACPSPANCIAVGYYFTGLDNNQGLLLTGSGTSWSATEAPVPGNADTQSDPFFLAVACPSTSMCAAFGMYFDSSGNSDLLVVTGPP